LSGSSATRLHRARGLDDDVHLIDEVHHALGVGEHLGDVGIGKHAAEFGKERRALMTVRRPARAAAAIAAEGPDQPNPETITLVSSTARRGVRVYVEAGAGRDIKFSFPGVRRRLHRTAGGPMLTGMMRRVAVSLALAVALAPAAEATGREGVAATVHVGSQTILLWRDRASGELALLRPGEGSVTRVIGTTLRETEPLDAQRVHLTVDRYPSRSALLRVVRLRFGLSGSAITAALTHGRPAPAPAAVIKSRRQGGRAPEVDLHRHFGTDVPALARAAGTAVAWFGPRALGLPLREAELLSRRSAIAPSAPAALLLYSDDAVDPAATGARTLAVQSVPAGLLHGRGPNPRFGGAVARRLDASELVFRIGRVVALASGSGPLTDQQLRTVLSHARLARP